MPDDPPVTQGGTQQGNPLNVREGQVGRLNVTRMDVATGQVKDLQVDILREIRDNTKTTGGKDKTLESALNKMNESLRTLVGKTTPGGGGGGEGAEASVQGMLTHLVKTQQDFKALDAILKSNTLEFKEWGKLVSEGIKIQRRATFREFNEQIFRTTQNLANLNTGISKVWRETKNLFEISQTGLIEVTAIFEDIAAGALRNRDALKTTVPTIIEMAERGNMLMGVLGDSAAEIATAFKANRKIVEEAGIDLRRIPFDQQNEILSDILISQRRVGVQGDNREILQSRAAREQLEHLQQISFATGISMKELMKLNVEERKTFEELAGLGIISAKQVTTMTNLSQTLTKSGQDVAVELFKGALNTVGGFDAFIANNPGLAVASGQGNNRALLRSAYETFQRTDLDEPEQAKRITELLQGLEALQSGATFGQAVKGLEGGGLLAQMRAQALGRTPGEVAGVEGGGFTGVAEALVETNESTGAEITSVINDFRAWLAANVGPFDALAVAMALHTPALIAHAIAIGGSSIGSLFRKLRGGGLGGGMTLETAKQASTRVTGMNAGKGGMRAAMSSAGRFGLTALGSTAAVGAAGWLGWEIGKALAPRIDSAIADATGVEGQTLGTTDLAASFFEAFGLGHNEDEKQKVFVKKQMQNVINAAAERRRKKREEAAKGVSPVKGILPDTGDPATVSPADAAGRKLKTTPPDDPMLTQLVSQNTHLMSIITLLTKANEIGTGIIDTIGGSFTANTTPLRSDRTIRRTALPVFSDMAAAGDVL